MKNSGRELEKLVREIETYLLPLGFNIESNVKEYNEDGIQIAEFDIEISGNLGSTEILWLIECRDRPSEGPAPGAWIEQLFGRRDRFGFNKITAVSTTGFSTGALKYAKEKGIETRTVSSITLSDVWDWFRISELTFIKDNAHLENINFVLLKIDDPKTIDKINEFLFKHKLSEPTITFKQTNELISPFQIFQSFLDKNPNIFSNIEPDQKKKAIFQIKFPKGDSGFHINYKNKNYDLDGVELFTVLHRETTKIPLTEIIEYKNTEKDLSISQHAKFDFELRGEQYELQFRKIQKTGETKVVINKKNA